MKTIETKDFTGDSDFRNFGFRVRFSSGVWSGWHKGYHSRLDAENAAKRALA